MIKTFKTRLKPTREQREYFEKCIGIRRWAYNYGVAMFYELARKDILLTGFAIQKNLNKEIADGNFAWAKEVNSMVRAEAFHDLQIAINTYAKARYAAKRDPAPTDVEKYKPHFQKKGKCVNSFRYNNKGNPWKYKSKHTFSLTRTRELKPLIIKTYESIEFLQNARIATITILREGKFYYLALTYEKTNQSQLAREGTIGLDLGIEHPIAAFDGVKDYIFDLPENLRKAEKNRDRCLRAFSRTQKGSKRHKKLHRRLLEAYQHENNIKRDFREKLTTWLTLNYSVIKIDDFGFKGAMNLKYTHRALYRAGIYAFKERLGMKAEQHNVQLLFVPIGTPTTQACSCCGVIPDEKVKLSNRHYKCKDCGFELDRDSNAARNVFNLLIK